MSGQFPLADYQHFGFSAQMIDHLRWLTCGVTSATGGALNGDFSTFGDQEDLGAAFDYRPPAVNNDAGLGIGGFSADFTARETAQAALGQVTGLGDASQVMAAIRRLQDDVQGLCGVVDEKDQELMSLRTRIRALECQTEGLI